MIRWESKSTRVACTAALCMGLAASASANTDRRKLDKVLTNRAGRGGVSRVIITMKPGTDPSSEIARLGGRLVRHLRLINGQAVELPNAALERLAARPDVVSLHEDRATTSALNRAAIAIGARAVQNDLGYTGAGIGVAVVDSGITAYHDDLTYSGTSPAVRTLAGQRTTAFVDFVNGRTTRYDDNGHGTHVAGIIGANGYDSSGARTGIAPEAHLVGLKVLDEQGRGVISNVIAALEWAVANRTAHNIRVVNLSVGAAVTESYRTDPLTVAAKRVVDAGIVLVAAAGNLGKNARGEVQYGAITAPGNAPWVLTVGAFSHEGTPSRTDDVMAMYSSRGPSAIDFAAKPDLVAPGTGIVSLADPSSLLYASKPEFLLQGSVATATRPYLSLTGTSMSAPMVSGSVALMLQANPRLTPNAVKAILQYTAQLYPGYDALTQGGGFLNTKGAVQLAQFFATAQEGSRMPIAPTWSAQILWGSQRLRGGVIRPNANAFQVDTVWGAAADADGDNIVWGTLRTSHTDNIVWGTFDRLDEDNIVWGTLRNDDGDNIVWGTVKDGDNIVWGTAADADNIVWGTASGGDNIVWGTAYADNIVWGTDCGGADCDNIVWGTAVDGDNIVWGTAADGDNIVWGTASGENIVWGTAEHVDNIVWGTAADVDNIVWGTSADGSGAWGTSGEDMVVFDDPNGVPESFEQMPWDSLFVAEALQPTAMPVADFTAGGL